MDHMDILLDKVSEGRPVDWARDIVVLKLGTDGEARMLKFLKSRGYVVNKNTQVFEKKARVFS